MTTRHGHHPCRLLRLAAVFVLCVSCFRSYSRAQGFGVTMKDTYCGLPETVDAAATGSIRFRPEEMFQQFDRCRGNSRGKYRTADGTCNSRFNWGSANMVPSRLLPNAYQDGISKPRIRDSYGYPLPEATTVSRLIHPMKDVGGRFTVMLMQWGQFIDHDTAAFPITSESNSSLKCCGANGEALTYLPSSECFPILMDSYDSNGRFLGNCMEFARSVAARDMTGRKLVPQEQVNSVTSFLDGSMIYGSSLATQHNVREATPGGLPGYLMKMSYGNLLPPSHEHGMCMAKPGEYCFMAGDSRVNEHPGLAILHTVFARLHNTLARQLRGLRPRDTHEEIFQVTRKIVIAIIQNIHYSEWLPLIIGQRAQRQHGVDTGYRAPYVPTDDPRISNEFSTAAFRFGHSLIPSHFFIAGKAEPLRNLFNRPSWLFKDFNGMFKSLVSPLAINGALTMDRFLTEEVTGHLFEPEHLGHGRGLDLAALNIQRGRDHGLQPYNHYRKHCGLLPLRDFSDLPAEVSLVFQKVYNSVDDIDLFSGIMSETAVDDGLVGPTLSCLLGNQFHFLKYGDRFYFETELLPEGFDDAQLAAIRKVTMAHLCCFSGAMDHVPYKAFELYDHYYNYNVPCASVLDNFLDLTLWQQ